jgi:hypothetical protein
MKRWLLAALAGTVVIAGMLFAVHQRLAASSTALPAPRIQLIRTPNSLSKFHLCAEAYAYLLATPDNPYKTDFSFHDPFRNQQDTIIPRFIAIDQRDGSLSFSVEAILRPLKPLTATISHIHELDGITVQLPNRQNQLQSSSVPQFIVRMLASSDVAVLDYTCPEQWKWSAASATAS